MQFLTIEFSIYTSGNFDPKTKLQILPVKDAYLPSGVYYWDKYQGTYLKLKKNINVEWRQYKYHLHAIITNDKLFSTRTIETNADFKFIAGEMSDRTRMLSTAQTYYHFVDFEIKPGDKLELDFDCNYTFIIKSYKL